MAQVLMSQLSATTSENTHLMGVGIRTFLIKNVGDNNVYISFDTAVDTGSSYLLEVGEVYSMDAMPIRLFYQAAASTATLYVVKILH